MSEPTGPIASSALPPAREPDAFGQAALLLAESTLHVLMETGVLTLAQAIDAVQTASEVKEELADETGETRRTMQASLKLLQGIEHSLLGANGLP